MMVRFSTCNISLDYNQWRVTSFETRSNSSINQKPRASLNSSPKLRYSLASSGLPRNTLRARDSESGESPSSLQTTLNAISLRTGDEIDGPAPGAALSKGSAVRAWTQPPTDSVKLRRA